MAHPESQIEVVVTNFDRDGNPITVVGDGEVVVGEEEGWRLWSRTMLMLDKIPRLPRVWKRINRKRKPMIIGGII